MSAVATVEWSDERHLCVGGVDFKLLDGLRPSDGDALLVFKWRALVEEYISLAPELRGGRIVELGVYRGGSTAFFVELFRPTVLVAVELATDEPEPLRAYRETSPRSGALRCHFGVDQADRARLASLVATEVDGPLDAVIDDASHVPGPTIASFEELYPRLREGGIYVIEDWSGKLGVNVADAGGSAGRRFWWRAAVEKAGVLGRFYEADPDRFRARMAEEPSLKAELEAAHPEVMALIAADAPVADVVALSGADAYPPPSSTPSGPDRSMVDRVADMDLTPVIARLVELSVTRPDVVASLAVRRGIAVVRRGPASLDPATFRLFE